MYVRYLFGFLSHVGVTLKLQQDKYEVIYSAVRLMIQIPWVIFQLVVKTMYNGYTLTWCMVLCITYLSTSIFVSTPLWSKCL